MIMLAIIHVIMEPLERFSRLFIAADWTFDSILP